MIHHQPERAPLQIEMCLKLKNFGSNTNSIFGGAKISNRQEENPYNSFKLPEYIALCRDYLGENFLTEELLQKRLQYIREEAKLEQKWPAGTTLCLAPIPCSENGFDLEVPEITAGLFLRTLVLDSADRSILGFSTPGCNIFKALPLEIRQFLTFQVPPYPPLDTPNPHELLAQLYEQKFHLAQSLFNTKTLPAEPKSPHS